MTRHKSIVSF